MVILISAFILISLACAAFRKMTFEISVLCILFVPIESALIGSFVGQSAILSICLLLINMVIAYLILPASKWNAKDSVDDLVPNIIWLVSAVFVYQLCLLWPDFISMGERLRDYALLGEVIKYPSHPNEPWMDGSPLNYYLYWYRLGSFLHQISGLEIWSLYHLLQSITLGLYIAVIYRVCSRFGKLQWFYALPIALLITFGSNPAGLFYTLEPAGQTWWGPSRVIKGTINEFPAWSFLLGDLHPHYLNLSLLLVIFCCTTLYWEKIEERLDFFSSAFLALLIGLGALWLYNSNAWEVPALGLFVGFAALIGLSRPGALAHVQARVVDFRKPSSEFLYGFFLCALVLVSLFISARTISSGNDKFRLVTSLIPVTSTKEFFQHWGFFLAFLIPGFLLRIESSSQRFVFILGLIACALSSVALPLIILLLVMQGLHVFTKPPSSRDEFFISVLGLTSLTLLFLPEVFFLDDPYGGENERMNTIFKAYSLNWGLLGCFTAITAAEQLAQCVKDKELLKFAKPITLIITGCLVLPFFISTIKERRSNNSSIAPVAQGLSMLEAQYPGAADAIKQFSQLPDGITLESQGNPYSLTTHVATLAAKRSYLGWINHVDLLTRNYAETKRRSEVTSQIYAALSCQHALELMQTEKITYVVVGPLERERFGNSLQVENGCLKKIISSGQYEIFTN